MNYADLTQLGNDQLAEYLWKRLRLEGVIAPPLAERFRMEPPEDFLIGALGHADPVLRERLTAAVADNLGRLALLALDKQIDAISSEQLASLAFLCSAIADSRLAHPLYLFSVALLQLRANAPELVDAALFHLLRTIAQLQNDRGLIPFWEQLWIELPVGRLRAIAFYGLTHADSSRALARLEELVSDERIDLPVVAWNLATEYPGIIALGKAAARLPHGKRNRLRAALVTAGADDDLLQDFDLHADEAGGPDFQFVVRVHDPHAEQERPMLVAAP